MILVIFDESAKISIPSAMVAFILYLFQKRQHMLCSVMRNRYENSRDCCLKLFSAGTAFIRQDLTSTGVLKELK